MKNTLSITKGLSLKENFSWNLVGNVVYAGCKWGMIIVLAKVTGPEEIGQFALALAVSAPVFLLCQLQLRGVQATDAKNEYLFSHYLGLRIVTTAIAMAVVVGIAFYGYDKSTALIITAVALSKLFESVSDVFYGLMQKHERMDRIATSMIAKGLLSLLSLGLVVLLTQELLLGILAMAAVWGGVLCTFDLANGKKILYVNDMPTAANRIRPVFDFNYTVKLAWLALPLGLVMALHSLNSNMTCYFIENYHGKSELGIFAVLVYLVTVGGVVINAMGQSATPRLAKHYAIGDINAFKNLLVRLLLIGIVLGIAIVIGAFFTGEAILRIIYGVEYAEKKNAFVWIMLAGSISYLKSFVGYGLTAARKFKIQTPLAGATAMITLILSYILIPNYGLIGAVIVVSISNFVALLLYSFFMIRYLISENQVSTLFSS